MKKTPVGVGPKADLPRRRVGAVHVTPMVDIRVCQFSSRNPPYLKYPSRPRFTTMLTASHARRLLVARALGVGDYDRARALLEDGSEHPVLGVM